MALANVTTPAVAFFGFVAARRALAPVLPASFVIVTALVNVVSGVAQRVLGRHGDRDPLRRRSSARAAP